EERIDGLEIDQDKRWDLVQMLNRYAHGDYAELLEAERQRDGSDLGVNLALAAEVSRPEAALKEEWLNKLINSPEQYRLATWRYAMPSLFPAAQLSLLDPLAERILSAVPEVERSADIEFLGEYTGYLSGATCSEASVARLAQANSEFASMQPTVV